MKQNVRPGATRETAATLGIAAAEDIDEFRALFAERHALEVAGQDTDRQAAIRREMIRLAPAVQRHLEVLGGALVSVDDGTAPARQPLPLTYVAAFGAREDYEPHVETLTGALQTAAERFRAGEGGDERMRRRRHRRANHRQRLVKRAALWAALGVAVLIFYVAGLRAFGDWGGLPDPKGADSGAPVSLVPGR